MPDSWSVPIATGLFTDLNDTIAKGPDLSWIGNLADKFSKGQDQRYTQNQRDVFKGGLPTDGQGNIDWNQAGQMLANVGGAGQIQNVIGLQNQSALQKLDAAAANSGIFSPVSGSQATPPTTAVAPPSSATSIPNNQPREQVAADAPAGTPMPPGQNLTGPNTTVTGVDYGPVQTGGQPANFAQRFAQASPMQPTGPQGNINEQTATAYEARAGQANLLSSQAARAGNAPLAQRYGEIATQAMKQAEIIRGALAKNAEVTPGQKDATASGLPSPRDYQANVEADKQDNDAFQKRYTAIQSAGEQSFNGIQKTQLMKQLTLNPSFYSGPLHEGVQTFNQFRAIFGSNPSTALPTEAFNKVANDMLQEQVKSMGQSGVGRVLQSEVSIMKQSIASLGMTPQSNRALAEMLSRVYKQNQDIAEITRTLPRKPGQMGQQLDGAISEYLKTHPLYNKQELQHPEILGAPDAPGESAQWSPQQKRQWAQSVGLKPGDPIRFNGQVVSVP